MHPYNTIACAVVYKPKSDWDFLILKSKPERPGRAYRKQSKIKNKETPFEQFLPKPLARKSGLATLCLKKNKKGQYTTMSKANTNLILR